MDKTEIQWQTPERLVQVLAPRRRRARIYGCLRMAVACALCLGGFQWAMTHLGVGLPTFFWVTLWPSVILLTLVMGRSSAAKFGPYRFSVTTEGVHEATAPKPLGVWRWHQIEAVGVEANGVLADGQDMVLYLRSGLRHPIVLPDGPAATDIVAFATAQVGWIDDKPEVLNRTERMVEPTVGLRWAMALVATLIGLLAGVGLAYSRSPMRGQPKWFVELGATIVVVAVAMAGPATWVALAVHGRALRRPSRASVRMWTMGLNMWALIAAVLGLVWYLS